jgi:hypothetical protein
MSAKLKLFSVVFILAVFLTGFLTPPPPPASNTTTLIVMKVGDVWKVVDATDSTNTKIKVKKKDTIVWKVEGTEAVFQFPQQLFDAVDSSDNLTDGYMKTVKNGHKLKLKIRSDAASGTYEYAVFCTTGGVFAKGGSPPKIVVE